MISGHGTIQTAVEATQLGAYDFLEKPLSPEKVAITISRALDHQTSLRAQEMMRQELDADRVAVYGGSYGGYMVLAALATAPDLWSAGVDIVGIANFVTFLENTGDYRRALREASRSELRESAKAPRPDPDRARPAG